MSPEVIVVTKARFLEIDIDRLSAIRTKAMGVLKGVPGTLSLTLWEKHSDPFAFAIIGHFESEEGSIQAWDALTRSPVMEIVTDLMSETPNSERFYVLESTGTSLDSLPVGSFGSISARIVDIGYGRKIADELSQIFEDLKLIPGFLGGLVGQHLEVSDEILGLAYWSSVPSFEASLPKKSMYKIDLYQRVL